MEEYRFKVYTPDGSHYFRTMEVRRKEDAFFIASLWTTDEYIPQVDVYCDSKLLASFYH